MRWRSTAADVICLARLVGSCVCVPSDMRTYYVRAYSIVRSFFPLGERAGGGIVEWHGSVSPGDGSDHARREQGSRR